METLTDHFRALVSRAEDEIDLARAVLLIAKERDPALDVERYVARLDQLAGRLRDRLAEEPGDGERILALNHFLFEDEGFTGNSEDYHDPRNSCLNEVLDRRLGIPITLSILYIEVGQRLGLPLQGVAFPGHFLVKCPVPEGMVVLDPYSRGISLSLGDLQNRLRDLRGGDVSRAVVAGLLVAAGKREIIARVLRNLKAIYQERQEDERAVTMVDWILLVDPGDRTQLRDRGLLYLRMECFRAALADLDSYLRLEPRAEDGETIRAQVMELRHINSRLN